MNEQRFAAPAKLNLMLRIVGRRPDGYHLLQTVFRFLDYGDEVRIAVREDGAISRIGSVPGVPADEDLSVKAARLLKSATGARFGADIELTKRLPLGAGLGGGSSDAATVLVALNQLWGTGLSRPSLQALGLKLGADVPVFVFGESALGAGIGEVLEPIALPAAWYVVLTPLVNVATARIFSDPGLKRDSKPLKMHGFSAERLSVDGTNDLQSIVCRHYPEVAHYLGWLQQHGPARMTGSGAAVFASFGSEQAARAVLDRLPLTMKGFVARGLDRHPLWELAQ